MRYLLVLLAATTTHIQAWQLDLKVVPNRAWYISIHDPLPYVAAGVTSVGALYYGSQTKLGRTFFQSIDAMMLNLGLVYTTKFATARLRPSISNTPNRWFAYGHNDNTSFYSGHVSMMTAAITPFVLNFGKESAWVYTLYGLTLHQMIGRVYTHRHWQSDVLVGAVMGSLTGWWATRFDTPLILMPLHNGVYVGFHTRF